MSVLCPHCGGTLKPGFILAGVSDSELASERGRRNNKKRKVVGNQVYYGKHHMIANEDGTFVNDPNCKCRECVLGYGPNAPQNQRAVVK